MISRTAFRWAVICVAVVVGLILVTHFWNRMWAWLPWSAESQLERAKVESTTAKSDAAARSLEVEGITAQQARQGETHRILVDVNASTAQAITEARSAPDAETPLDPATVARIRAQHDRLCDAVPAACPAAAPADPG